MAEFTYLVFLSVASVAAALIAVFAAGVGAVLLSSPGGEPHRRAHTATTPQVTERLAA